MRSIGRPHALRWLLAAACGLGLVTGGALYLHDTNAGARLPAEVRQNSCVQCHREKTPAIYADWAHGVHAREGVHCDKCHRANTTAMASKTHLEHDPKPISAVVTPLTCGGCHKSAAESFAASKHAQTRAIVAALEAAGDSAPYAPIEAQTGCEGCHGSEVILVDSRPSAATWPNVGIGRQNPDGSLGSCSSCHTRHTFSKAEARKPEACQQCHLGPDHPQMEIYAESKHGAIYQSEGDDWTWTPTDGQWRAGRDFRAPTCAACHMSAAADQPASHDVTRRLSWELQTPRTIHPQDFTPWPAQTSWQTERKNMRAVCRQCHSEPWVDGHFVRFDQAVEHYNQTYYDPVAATMEGYYTEGVLDQDDPLDEALEWRFYRFWHFEGRRARMGVAMMAPDYAWWHGFFELKQGAFEIGQGGTSGDPQAQ